MVGGTPRWKERERSLLRKVMFPWTTGSGSQTSEVEAELMSVQVSDRKEEVGLVEKKQNSEENTWNRRTAKMEGGIERSLQLSVN